MQSLATTHNNNLLLQHVNTSNKSTVSRVNLFSAWLTDNNLSLLTANLSAYRDYLLNTRQLSPASASSHLSTLRGAYKRMLLDNAFRDSLYASTPDHASTADKKAMVDEVLTRLTNASNAVHSKVQQTTKQDTADNEHVRLNMSQVRQLLHAPTDGDMTTKTQRLIAFRDFALLALAIATGLREGELVQLTVDDLRQRFGDVLALRVRHGKGDKQRLIPYGAFDNVLTVVSAWLDEAGITEGFVFRSVDRHGNVRNSMTTRSVIYIVNRYSVCIDGERVQLSPHDLRRTYARLMYVGGMDLISIQQNLGHASTDTTLTYIGTMDASKREPVGVLPVPVLSGSYD